MSWYCFRRILGGSLLLVVGGIVSGVECDDHFDEEYVYIRAINVVDAYSRAYGLVRN